MLIGFNETAEYQLRHPITNEPLEDAEGNKMIAVIYGKHSSTYKNASTDFIKKMKKKGDKETDTAELENDSVDLIASCVKEFVNLHIEYQPKKFLDPKDIKGTLVNAFWIKDQLNRAIVDLENFSIAP